MGEADFIVPVGANQQKVLHLRMRDKMFEQIKAGCIEPLQIIEKQRERMLLPGENGEETPEYHLETILPVLRRKLRNRRLLSDDEMQLRNQVDHDLTVRTKCLQQRSSPLADFRLAPGKDLPDQRLESLRQRRIGDVALVLVELAAGKETARRRQRFVKLAHHRRLADSGIAGNQHQLGGAPGHHLIKRRDQRPDLGLAPI